MLFGLPERWVYVYYEDGKTENVANTDTLTRSEAERYKLYWEQARGKKVVRVDLLTNEGKTVFRHDFTEGA